MPERKYQKLTFLVEVIVPDDFPIEQTKHDIETSIQFGRRIVTFRSRIRNYIDPARREEVTGIHNHHKE